LQLGLSAATNAALSKGDQLLDATQDLAGKIPGLNNLGGGNVKAGKPYLSPTTNQGVMDVTLPDGRTKTVPIDSSNSKWYFADQNAYNNWKLQEQEKLKFGKTKQGIVDLEERRRNAPPTQTQQRQWQHDADLHGKTLKSGEKNTETNANAGITVTKIGDKGETHRTEIIAGTTDRRTDAEKDVALANISFQDRQLAALVKQNEGRLGLDTRAQEAAERNMAYDQQMNSWRANAEIEAAQHAWRKNLPSGLATAAQGLALLVG
jgi:hypothetical protein